MKFNRKLNKKDVLILNLIEFVYNFLKDHLLNMFLIHQLRQFH